MDSISNKGTKGEGEEDGLGEGVKKNNVLFTAKNAHGKVVEFVEGVIGQMVVTKSDTTTHEGYFIQMTKPTEVDYTSPLPVVHT